MCFQKYEILKAFFIFKGCVNIVESELKIGRSDGDHKKFILLKLM